MLTPIILLVLMTAPYLISRVLKAVMQRDVDLRAAGAIGLTLLFIVTGIGYFTDTEAMAQMLPAWVRGGFPLSILREFWSLRLLPVSFFVTPGG